MVEWDYSECEDFDPEDPNKPVGGGLEPGKAHLLVASVEFVPEKDYYKLIYEVIGHEKGESQLNKTVWDFISTKGKGPIKRLKLGLACGLYTKQEYVKAKTKGGYPDFNLEDAYGKTFCATLQKKKDSNFAGIGWNYYSVKDASTDPAYPINDEYESLSRETKEVPF